VFRRGGVEPAPPAGVGLSGGANSMTHLSHRTKPGAWAIAFLSALAVNTGAVLLARALHVLEPGPAYAGQPEAIQVIFSQEPRSSTPESPELFTELPPDRVDEPPERADFLSNVNSRARDDAAGGDDRSPLGEGRSELPQVRMEGGAGEGEVSAEVSGASPSVEVPPQERESPPSAGEGPGPEGVAAQDPEGADDIMIPGRSQVPSFAARERRARVSNPLSEFRRRMFGESGGREPGTIGDDDVTQEESSNREGNALLSGAISLNTVEWDYAPWLQRFRRELMRHWFAPYGYYLGAIHGWTLVELEIAKSGDVLRMEVLGEEGHEALRKASLAALRGAMPYRPLPEDFPEETLILRVKLIYPEISR